MQATKDVTTTVAPQPTADRARGVDRQEGEPQKPQQSGTAAASKKRVKGESAPAAAPVAEREEYLADAAKSAGSGGKAKQRLSEDKAAATEDGKAPRAPVEQKTPRMRTLPESIGAGRVASADRMPWRLSVAVAASVFFAVLFCVSLSRALSRRNLLD